MNEILDPRMKRRGAALVLGGALLLALTRLAVPASHFWPAYFVALVFTTSLALGALFFVLIHYACRAGWSVLFRRQAELIAGAMPLLALLYVPLAWNLDAVFPWTAEELPPGARRTYLASGFFAARGGAYLVIWSALASWFRVRSARQDLSADPAVTRQLEKASGPALIVFGVSVTLAAFDWLMSLEPHWYSSILGVHFFAGSVVGYLALQAAAGLWLKRSHNELSTGAPHFHALAKLLFGFVCFWAYVAFSQYLLVWYAALPEETIWYSHRLEGAWSHTALVLALGHFVIPFAVLLPEGAKKSPRILGATAAWLLVMHYLDLYWTIVPSAPPEAASFHGSAVVTAVAATAVLAGIAISLAGRVSLSPRHDPRLSEALAFHG